MVSKDLFLENLRKDFGIDLSVMVHDVVRYMPDLNEKKFREAFYFAAKAHDGQFRMENKPYITHPVEAARILISMHADEDTLIAAFLHDVPEDTAHTIDEIEAHFGKKIAFLVEGITKLSKVHFRSDMAERQIESLKKLFIHSAEDPRIILIKLADRLHNMRTLQYLNKPEKRTRIARETLEIFVPIANLLGIEELKSELEDLCFRFLFAEDYEHLSEHIKQSKEKNKQIFEDTIELIQKKLDADNLKASVYVRQKNLYHIYKKMKSHGKMPEDLEDVIALRILVPEREDCYKVLGILHATFKPKPSKFKDYIAVPKINGYQSLHTTVFGLNGFITEFQVRTNQMHLEAEYGIAAHYFYDEQKKKTPEVNKRSYWAEKILEMQKNQDLNNSFLEDLKLDILQERIFVFTPHGDPIDLPKEATCIDFAYCIHSEVGHRALEADINGELMPLTSLLSTGDTVRIITSDVPQEPKREWLSFAKTNLARNKIREYLKRDSHEAKIRTGRRLLQKEFDRAGLGLIKNIGGKKFKAFIVQYSKAGYKSFEDVLMAIGEGSLNTLEFVNFLYFKDPVAQKRKHEAVSEIQYATVNVKVVFEHNDPLNMQNLLRIINGFGIHVVKIQGACSFMKQNFVVRLLIEAKDFQQLSELFANIEHIHGVKRVERLFLIRKIAFITFSLLTFVVWAFHPYVLYYSREILTSYNPLFLNFFLYFSLALLFLMVFLLKRVIHRSFPELRETNTLWMMTFVLSIFALVTFFAELFFFHLEFNWLIASGVILIILSYLGLEYIDYHESQRNLK